MLGDFGLYVVVFVLVSVGLFDCVLINFMLFDNI